MSIILLNMVTFRAGEKFYSIEVSCCIFNHIIVVLLDLELAEIILDISK